MCESQTFYSWRQRCEEKWNPSCFSDFTCQHCYSNFLAVLWAYPSMCSYILCLCLECSFSKVSTCVPSFQVCAQVSPHQRVLSWVLFTKWRLPSLSVSSLLYFLCILITTRCIYRFTISFFPKRMWVPGEEGPHVGYSCSPGAENSCQPVVGTQSIFS